MIKIIIDEKLEIIKEKITDVCQNTFDYIGFPYQIISTLEEVKSSDILFCYSLRQPSPKEILELMNMSTTQNIFFFSANLDLYENISDTYLDTLKKEFYDTFVLSKIAPTIDHQRGKFFNKIFFNFDFFGNIYYFINLKNEFSDLPIVNKLIKILERQIIDILDKKLCFVKKRMWPNNQIYAMSLSATADKLHKWPSYSGAIKKIFSSFFLHPILSIKEYFALNFLEIEPYWNFDFFRKCSCITYYMNRKKIISNLTLEDRNIYLDLVRIQNSCENILKKKKEKRNYLFPYKNTLPITISTSDFRRSHFSYIKKQTADQIVENILENASKTEGLVSINFNFSDIYDIPYTKSLFDFCLTKTKSEKIYFASKNDILEWWKFRNSLKIVLNESKIELQSEYNINIFHLEVFGDFEVTSVSGCDFSANKKVIKLEKIKKNIKVEIRLKVI